ncbi:MAG: hypothetical protein J6334_08500 [Kiritimatiellae bacterium]|nr:hypothetical protein [Kiritimatiellia bacterium]
MGKWNQVNGERTVERCRVIGRLVIVVAMAVAVGGCVTSSKMHAWEADTSNPGQIRTAVFAGTGLSGGGAMEWIRLVNASPELKLVLLDAEGIRSGGLEKVDLLVMPGGSSPDINRDLGTKGKERVKDFIRNGGGYIGTCAGCCLMMETAPDPTRGIGVMPFYRSGSKGRFLMPVALNEAGAKAMGMKAATYSLQYSHGPILEPSAQPIEGASFEVWGTNRSDSGQYGKGPEMFGRAAIVGGTYGKGKVFVTSCHPEYFESTRVVVQGAFRYVTGREVTFPIRPRTPRAYTVGIFTAYFVGLETAQAILALDADPMFDLVPLTSEDIRRGALDHVDALVFPHAQKGSFGDLTGGIVKRFIARGGYAVGWGGGKSYLLEGAELCADSSEVIARLRSKGSGVRQ